MFVLKYFARFYNTWIISKYTKINIKFKAGYCPNLVASSFIVFPPIFCTNWSILACLPGNTDNLGHSGP